VTRSLAAGVAGAALLVAGIPAWADRVHVVQPGDTLWTISADALGDASLWPALYRANRDQIKDPDTLHPGQPLGIPAVEPAERARLRREARELLSR
jgi:nucleoid-associated protein YgaU